MDAIVNHQHKRRIYQLIDRLANKSWYEKHHERWKEGLMFSGPPGCGKSKFVIAMAMRLKRHVIDVRWERIQSEDEMERLLSIDQIQDVSFHPSQIIFMFDEFTQSVFEKKSLDNSLSSATSSNNVASNHTLVINESKSSNKKTLDFNLFLSRLDGPQQYHGVLFVATTNDTTLNERLCRDGRMTLFQFQLPTLSEIQEMIQFHVNETVTLDCIQKWVERQDRPPTFATVMTRIKQYHSDVETSIAEKSTDPMTFSRFLESF
jgi:SpoVK/Ycf46/Vps4 family AAA+-type ATPase